MIEKTKQELWQQRISAWEQSGMEIRAWCLKHNIEEQQFHYYKRQLRVKQEPSQIPMFAEVSLGSSSSNTRIPSVENRLVLYVQGMKLVISDEFQPETLLSFLLASSETIMMKQFINSSTHIYLACGSTDFRKQ